MATLKHIIADAIASVASSKDEYLGFTQEDGNVTDLVTGINTRVVLPDADGREISQQAGALAMAGAVDGGYLVTQEGEVPKETIASSFGFSDSAESVLTQESFTGIKPEVLAGAAYGFNFGATKQDAFAESFFPTVLKPAGTTFLRVDLEVEYFLTPFIRKDGKVSLTSNKMQTIASAINDNKGPMANAGRAALPNSILDAAYFPYFVKALETDATTADGENIKTAPITINKTVPAIEMTQTAGTLAKGTMDETDMLDPAIPLNAIFVTVDGESYKFDTSGYAGNEFVPAAGSEGDDMDIQLAFGASITVDVNSLTDYLTGAAQTKITGIPVGVKAVYDVKLSGQGNVVDGEFAVYANEFTLSGFVDAEGKEVAKAIADGYKDEAGKINTGAVVGYNAPVSLINDNLRIEGDSITVRNKYQTYSIKPKKPLSIDTAEKDFDTASLDAAKVSSLANYVVGHVNLSAVKTLTDFVTFMKSNVANGIDVKSLKLAGVARHVINPRIVEKAIDVSAQVDATSSLDKVEAIKASIVDNLRIMVTDLLVTSNAYTVLSTKRDTFDIIVGTSPTIASVLNGEINIGDKVKVKVVPTVNSLLDNKCIFTITNFGADRNDDIDPFIFGNFVYVPTLVGKVSRTVDNRKTVLNIVQPRWSHIVHLPLVGELTITGIDTFYLNKLVAHRHAV